MATQPRLLDAARNGLLPLIQGAPVTSEQVAVTPVQAGALGMQPVAEPFYQMKPGGGKMVGETETPWYKDPNVYNALALGFNSMRLNPDQGLAAALQNRIKTAQEIKVAEGSKNKTIAALRKMGMDQGELELLAENPELLKIAATAMYKQQMGVDATAEMQTFKFLTSGFAKDEVDEARRVKLGLKPRASSLKYQNLGTSVAVMDGDQLIATLPIDLAGVQMQTGLGKDVAEARSNYSSIKSTLNVQREALQSLLNDPAVDDIFGTVSGAMPSIRQSSVDAEARLGQVKGGAFLQAIQALRGMGALSNTEGEAATRAATALNLRMSPKAAKEEMRRMVAILDAGQERALRGTRVDENEMPSYMKDWQDTYSGAGGQVKVGGSIITEIK